MSSENGTPKTEIVDMAGKVVGEVRPGYHFEPGFEEPDTAVDLTGGTAGVLVAGQYELGAGVKVVRVTATVTFEAYALTEGFYAGKSLEAKVAEEIVDAIGYRAVHGTDTEEGDALIAMTTHPAFAVDVRTIEVSVLDRPVDLAHVVEQAEGTSGEW